MIISQEQEVVFGSANQQATAFGIENNAKAFILLSDKLYTNKPYAVIRELSTNCLDAHKLNGQTRPFEVKLPTRLDPRFVIRDFGPGLSDEQIRGKDGKPGLYNTYFASTKADSNDYIGAMGLGSKSPFSYTKTFTIISCHDGRKMGYTAIMKNLGPEIIPLFNDPMQEDDETGIEITVPVKVDDISKWHHEARRTFRAFTGVEPKILGSGLDIDYFPEFTPEKQWFNLPSDYTFEAVNAIYAVYGRIVYPIKLSEIPDIKYQWLLSKYSKIFINFELGELDITPSREELSYNEETIENIRNKINSIETVTLTNDIAHFETIQNKRELVRELNDLNRSQRSILGNRAVSIQGKSIQDWISEFDTTTINNLMYNSSMVAYFVNEEAQRRRISNSWSVRNRLTADGLTSINNKKIVFMIDDKPSKRASTIRGMRLLGIHSGCFVILIDPENAAHLKVIDEAKKLFVGDEVVVFKCSEMTDAWAKDAEVNVRTDKSDNKRPKSANVHKLVFKDSAWFSESLCLSANEVRELEGYAVGINRDSITIFPGGHVTALLQSSINQLAEIAEINEYWVIRPGAMKYAEQNKNLEPLFDELVSKYIELIDDVLDEVIPPRMLNARRMNNLISIKALNPLIKNFVDTEKWENAVKLNSVSKLLTTSNVGGDSENAVNIALCQKIYNNFVALASKDFSKKQEEFSTKYPIIWYMLDEFYIHEEKYYNDLAKIAALSGAI